MVTVSLHYFPQNLAALVNTVAPVNAWCVTDDNSAGAGDGAETPRKNKTYLPLLNRAAWLPPVSVQETVPNIFSLIQRQQYQIFPLEQVKSPYNWSLGEQTKTPSITAHHRIWSFKKKKKKIIPTPPPFVCLTHWASPLTLSKSFLRGM